jgi:polyribonucleotide nucleotidyltransferase
MLTREVEVGSVYHGKVVRIMPFGAFVQILPGKDGLVHISELADHRVPDVESVVKIGDELDVMVINIDHMGRIDLSARALLEQQAGGEPRLGPPDRGGRERNGDGARGDGGGRRGGGGGFRDRGPRDRGDDRPRQDRPRYEDEDSGDQGPSQDRERSGRRPVGGYQGGRRSPPPYRR